MKHLSALTAGIAMLAAPLALAPAASAQTPGSVTASLTSPVAITGTATAPGLTCTIRQSAKTYNLRISRVSVNGYQFNGNATIVGYTGPGTYSATMTFSAAGSGTTIGGGGTKVPVTITATGGSAAFTRTASGARAPKAAGATATGTISWTCPSA